MNSITTVFQVIAMVASVAHFATANVPGHGDRGRDSGRGKQGGGEGRDDEDKRRTFILEIAQDKERGAAALASTCAAVATLAGGEVAEVYDAVLHGCAIALPSRAVAASLVTLQADLRVMRMEEDQRVYAAYSWGLDRVDQCDLPLTGQAPTQVDATGVRVYIVDSGIDRRHSDFNGMVDRGSSCHTNKAQDGRDAFNDGNGHG